MENVLDIFKNDAFSQANLREIPMSDDFTPGAIGAMNLFTPRPINTEVVIIYMEAGQLHLIPATDRGAPEIMATRKTGEFFGLRTSRLAKTDSVRAAEMLNLANSAFPLSQRMRDAGTLVRDRMNQLRKDMEATRELHRLGAVQGKVIDADGTRVLFDFFTAFGISQPAYVDIAFDDIGEEDLAFEFQENFYVPMYRAMQIRQGGVMVPTGFTVAAFVGDTFWNKLIRHPAVREIWKAQQVGRSIAMAANPLATPPLWTSIEFAGVEWIHYMGAISGPLKIATDEARFFPRGAPDTYEVYFSPGETLSSVTGNGQEEYPIVRVDPRTDPEFIDISLRTYPLYGCLNPGVLLRGRAV
jgi:hypothetical protein